MQSLPSPLKRIGGKRRLSKDIVGAFPDPKDYDLYVEVCGGAAWVLLARPQEWREQYGHREVFNDLDNNLVVFWQVMRDRGEEMAARLQGLLYSRKQYYDWYRSLFDQSKLDDLERAVRFFYCLRSTGTGWLRRSPVGWDYRPLNLYAFRSALTLFKVIQRRLEWVCIDNRDALATILRYDSERTLFYIDSPYKGSEGYYEASRNGFPHEKMAQVLQTIKGMAAVSYYPDPEIDAWYAGWRRLEWCIHKQSQIQLATREEDFATELLLCNYPEPEPPKPPEPRIETLSLWGG